MKFKLPAVLSLVLTLVLLPGVFPLTPALALRGQFDLKKFNRDVYEMRFPEDIPYFEYTMGPGETLDELFNTIVTRDCRDNKAVEKAFKSSLKCGPEGWVLSIDIIWLQDNPDISVDVRCAIDRAWTRQQELFDEE